MIITLVCIFWAFVILVLILPNLYNDEVDIKVSADEVSRDEDIVMLFEADITYDGRPFFLSNNNFELSWSDGFEPYDTKLVAYYGDKKIEYDNYEITGYEDVRGVLYSEIKSRDGLDAITKVEIKAYAKKDYTGQRGTANAALNYHNSFLINRTQRAGNTYFEY